MSPLCQTLSKARSKSIIRLDGTLLNYFEGSLTATNVTTVHGWVIRTSRRGASFSHLFKSVGDSLNRPNCFELFIEVTEINNINILVGESVLLYTWYLQQKVYKTSRYAPPTCLVVSAVNCTVKKESEKDVYKCRKHEKTSNTFAFISICKT